MNSFKTSKLHFTHVHQNFQDLRFAKRLADLAREAKERDAMAGFVRSLAEPERPMMLHEVARHEFESINSVSLKDERTGSNWLYGSTYRGKAMYIDAISIFDQKVPKFICFKKKLRATRLAKFVSKSRKRRKSVSFELTEVGREALLIHAFASSLGAKTRERSRTSGSKRIGII